MIKIHNYVKMFELYCGRYRHENRLRKEAQVFLKK